MRPTVGFSFVLLGAVIVRSIGIDIMGGIRKERTASGSCDDAVFGVRLSHLSKCSIEIGRAI